MNLDKILEGLYARRAMLEKAIEDLRALVDTPGYQAQAAPRRGRAGMGEAEKQEVSIRMKNYWAAWREKKARAETSARNGRGDRSEAMQHVPQSVERLEDSAHVHIPDTEPIQNHLAPKH